MGKFVSSIRKVWVHDLDVSGTANSCVLSVDPEALDETTYVGDGARAM